ncbi:hypothetical protein Btru_027454 [Bulinus truncatus]|nr:hypothetical protein Btru_027454 [Bulinus truncatus]
MTFCLDDANGRGTCDQITLLCTNGVCQLQADQLSRCTCLPGFILDPVNPLLCNAIPPCNLIPGPPELQCTNGMCLPQSQTGLYSCFCYPGYQLSSANPNICEDMNECLMSNTGCAPGTCYNEMGGYSCTGCIPGMTLVAGRCEAPQTVAAMMPRQPYRSGPGSSNMLMAYLMDDMFL